jgi:hypothetical protein
VLNRNRIPAVFATVVASGFVIIGSAFAQGYGDHHDSGSSQPAPKDGAKWQQFKQLSPSRLSQSAYLTGAAEVDEEGDDAGDPDGKGSATFLQVDESTVCYGFTARGIDTPTIVHIHRGVAGESGPPVVLFNNVPKDANGQPSGDPGTSSGCKTVTDPNELAALRRIRKNPSGYYLNIHSQTFPDGAIRGQLAPVWHDDEG